MLMVHREGGLSLDDTIPASGAWLSIGPCVALKPPLYDVTVRLWLVGPPKYRREGFRRDR